MLFKKHQQVIITTFLILTTFGTIHAQAVLSAKEIAQNTLPSVVLVICDDGNNNIVQGSGFFIRPGIIVTNYHVVEGMARGFAQIRSAVTQQTTNFRIARIIAVDEEADLAILSAPTAIEKSITPLRLAPESYTIEVGETVFALGNPEGLVGTISPGIISASLRSSQRKARIQITAPISQGSSGGPVVNDAGQVIGVAVGSISEGQNLNFAIPVSLVYDLTKTAQFPSAIQNSQDMVADTNDNLPKPWIQGADARGPVSGPGIGSGVKERGAETAAYFFYRGGTNLDNNRFTEAIADYTKAIQINPQFAEAYKNRGFAYRRQGNDDLAIADYTKAIEINPQDANSYNSRGNAYNDQGNSSFAIADFTKAIQINPQASEYYYSRGYTYYRQKNYNFAIADYNKAIEISPQFAVAYANRGYAYFKQENYKFAIADLTKAIQINPQNGDYYFLRGIAYSEKGDDRFAIADYTQAIQINPQDAAAYHSRGVLYCYRLKQKTLANSDLKRAVELGARDVKECR